MILLFFFQLVVICICRNNCINKIVYSYFAIIYSLDQNTVYILIFIIRSNKIGA